MTNRDVELLQRLDLEEQLSFCRGKLQEYRDHIQYMCLHKDDFVELFEKRIRVMEFQAHKYKDEESYNRVAHMKKLWNSFRYLLNDCK